jgi:prepilin-type N-terminal cleavage/methylation domain-containing protein
VLRRRGFTLVEVMVSLVLLSLIGLALTRVMRVMTGTTHAQMEIATSQLALRVGAFALPQEFREIGYDTASASGTVSSDIEAIAARRISFRAMRGLGFTCGAPTLTGFTIRKPVLGMRDPAISDGFLLFVESDPSYAADDQWVPMAVLGIDSSATCDGGPAIGLTLAAPPEIDPVSHAPIAISQVFVGGPVRWFERVEYAAMIDRAGRHYLGFRSLSRGEREPSPILGPLADTSEFQLTYYAASGALLDPATASPLAVRSIGIDLVGATTERVSLAGGDRRSRKASAVSTRVALRNTLRP